MQTDPYRSQAQQHNPRTYHEKILDALLDDETKMRQLRTYYILRDIRLFLGVLFVFLEILAFSALTVYGLVNPMLPVFVAFLFCVVPLGVATMMVGGGIFIAVFFGVIWLIEQSVKFLAPRIGFSALRSAWNTGDNEHNQIKWLKRQIDEEKRWELEELEEYL